MKRSWFLALLLFVFIQPETAFAGGGPDAYGYTWKGSFDSGGPVYTWIDISTTGTLVSGLLDDNSIGPVGLGFNFHYYWQDYNAIKLGSNGWLGFDNTSNIAHCFPYIPDPAAIGQADNFLAPLMADLNFAVGSGKMYYWSNQKDTFIVAYHNVPFWQQGAPGWIGDMTFQAILSAQDSSIVFQYKTMNATIPVNACAQDLVVGIESMTGNYGLEVYKEIMPSISSAIKFYYPDSVLISIYDATPHWNANVKNGGQFFGQGLVTLNTNIKNVGNTDITTPITVTSKIIDIFNSPVHTATATVSSLMTYTDTTVIHSSQANLQGVGQYYFETAIGNSQDIYAGNDTTTTEIDVVNLTFSTAQLSYSLQTVNTGTISWAGGDTTDGLGIYIEPPVYPCDIVSVEYFVSSTLDGFMAKVFDDNGPGGAPGTVLESQMITSPVSGWFPVTMTNTITITSGGFYVAWMMGGANASLGTENTGPMSRRNYEVLSGGWSDYRQNKTEEVMIRVDIGNFSCLPTASFSNTVNGANAIFTNNSGSGQFFDWDFGDGTTDTIANPIHTFAAAGTYTVCLIVTNPCGTDTTCSTITLCFDPTAGFAFAQNGATVNFTDQTIGGATIWGWDFGDGNASNQQHPTHTYAVTDTYTVCLFVNNGCAWDTLCQTVILCASPVPGFTHVITGAIAVFTNTATGNPTSYLYDFGDGNTSTQPGPIHTYAASGQYTVCQTVTNICGDDSTCSILGVTVGRDEGISRAIDIYPNPAYESFTIRVPDGVTDGFRLSLKNTIGQEIRNLKSGPVSSGFELEVDVRELPSGVYFLGISMDHTFMIRKIIIN